MTVPVSLRTGANDSASIVSEEGSSTWAEEDVTPLETPNGSSGGELLQLDVAARGTQEAQVQLRWVMYWYCGTLSGMVVLDHT